MEHHISKVKLWQELFGRNGHIVHDHPCITDNLTAHRRVEFLMEESLEYLKAIREQDIVEVLDALCDLQFFLYGMVVIHGLQDVFAEAFNTVCASNMSKLDDNGQPLFREDGKVIKGPNYWAPTEELKLLLNQYANQ